MLNVNEAIAVIYVAHEIEKLKEVLETRVGVPTELIIELQNKVVAAGNYAVFARYKQGPAYSWFYNLQRQVMAAAEVTDRYNPSPVLKGEDPTNSKDDLKFDKGFDADLELERLLEDSGLVVTEDDLDAFSNLTMPEIKHLISLRKRRELLRLKAKAAEDLEKLWAARDQELAEHDATANLIFKHNGHIRCSCGCDRV
jgi:hypothetical protein